MSAGAPRTPESADEEVLGAEQESVLSTGSDAERVAEMRDELAAGFRLLRTVHRGVTVLGSARTLPEDSVYALARELGARLAREGFAVITGGGPGVMEAANRGAREAGGASVGLSIEVPHERHPNPYVDVGLSFRYFFARKVMFVRYSLAFVAMPGGFGTLDELFEVLTLIQTAKVRDFPVVLVGGDFWSGLVEWASGTLVARGTVSPAEVGLLSVVDELDDALEIVRDAARRQGR